MIHRIHDTDDYYYQHDFVIRKEIAEFAIQMEIEMAKKDEKYKSKDGMQFTFKKLYEHLCEERDEVDFEVDLSMEKGKKVSFHLNTELVHEAILCMIIRNKIMNYLTLLGY